MAYDDQLPKLISSIPTDIGSGGLNLESVLVPDFIPTIPYDPSTGDMAETNYVLFEETDGRLTASASSAELGEIITITR